MSEYEKRIEEITEREKGATKGPWHITPNGTIKAWLGPVGDVPGYYSIGGFAFEPDNEFAINAREDISWLIAQLERLENELEEAQDYIADIEEENQA